MPDVDPLAPLEVPDVPEALPKDEPDDDGEEALPKVDAPELEPVPLDEPNEDEGDDEDELPEDELPNDDAGEDTEELPDELLPTPNAAEPLEAPPLGELLVPVPVDC